MHYELSFWRDDEDYQAAIFSETSFRAEEIWIAIAERFWLMPQGWLGSEWDAWMLHGRVKHEREACSRCVEGIGIYSPDQGWKILPIDYAAIGMAPPDEVTIRRWRNAEALAIRRALLDRDT